jgi:hypothetical protein
MNVNLAPTIAMKGTVVDVGQTGEGPSLQMTFSLA